MPIQCIVAVYNGVLTKDSLDVPFFYKLEENWNQEKSGEIEESKRISRKETKKNPTSAQRRSRKETINDEDVNKVWSRSESPYETDKLTPRSLPHILSIGVFKHPCHSCQAAFASFCFYELRPNKLLPLQVLASFCPFFCPYKLLHSSHVGLVWPPNWP